MQNISNITRFDFRLTQVRASRQSLFTSNVVEMLQNMVSFWHNRHCTVQTCSRGRNAGRLLSSVWLWFWLCRTVKSEGRRAKGASRAAAVNSASLYRDDNCSNALSPSFSPSPLSPLSLPSPRQMCCDDQPARLEAFAHFQTCPAMIFFCYSQC